MNSTDAVDRLAFLRQFGEALVYAAEFGERVGWLEGLNHQLELVNRQLSEAQVKRQEALDQIAKERTAFVIEMRTEQRKLADEKTRHDAAVAQSEVALVKADQEQEKQHAAARQAILDERLGVINDATRLAGKIVEEAKRKETEIASRIEKLQADHAGLVEQHAATKALVDEMNARLDAFRK